jgi:hypothetical protein
MWSVSHCIAHFQHWKHTSGCSWRSVWVWMLPPFKQLFGFIDQCLSQRLSWLSFTIHAHLLVGALALGHLCAAQTVIECREPGLSIRYAGLTSRGRVLERADKGNWGRLAGCNSKNHSSCHTQDFCFVRHAERSMVSAYHGDAGELVSERVGAEGGSRGFH